MPNHIVSSFDSDLKQLSAVIAQMGGLAERQVAAALDCIERRDVQIAQTVVTADTRIDALEDRINEDCLRLLALRQPMALDLREIVAALKISADLERIGDLSKNIARRSIAIAEMAAPNGIGGLSRLGRLTQEMIKDVLDSYIDRDADRARAVWHRDEEVDALHTGIFRELLTYMMEDPRNITVCTHLLFAAKNLERIGDHATNIAEIVHFLVDGEKPSDLRPKRDRSSDVRPTQVEVREGGLPEPLDVAPRH